MLVKFVNFILQFFFFFMLNSGLSIEEAWDIYKLKCLTNTKYPKLKNASKLELKWQQYRKEVFLIQKMIYTKQKKKKKK